MGALEPAVAALGRWGAASLGVRADQALRSHWLALALKAFFHADEADGVAAVYELRLREAAFRLAVADGALEVTPAPTARPTSCSRPTTTSRRRARGRARAGESPAVARRPGGKAAAIAARFQPITAASVDRAADR